MKSVKFGKLFSAKFAEGIRVYTNRKLWLYVAQKFIARRFRLQRAEEEVSITVPSFRDGQPNIYTGSVLRGATPLPREATIFSFLLPLGWNITTSKYTHTIRRQNRAARPGARFIRISSPILSTAWFYDHRAPAPSPSCTRSLARVSLPILETDVKVAEYASNELVRIFFLPAAKILRGNICVNVRDTTRNHYRSMFRRRRTNE